MPRIEGTKVFDDGMGRTVHSPIIIVSLSYGGFGLDVQAVVDSGADSTMVPAEVAAALGVEWGRLPSGGAGGGAGGTFEMRPAPVTIKYGHWKFEGPVLIAEPKRLPVVLLGRSDFFQSFVARFHWFKTPPEFHLDPAAIATKSYPHARAKV